MYLLIQCLFTLATDYKWKTDVVSVKLMSSSAHTLMYFTTIGYVFYNDRIIKQVNVFN